MRDTVHIPDDLQKRVTALVPAVNAQVLVGTANSTAVIRHALALGLTLLEQAVSAGKPIPQVRDLTPPPVISSRVVEVPEEVVSVHFAEIVGSSSSAIREMFQSSPVPMAWPALADVGDSGNKDSGNEAVDDGWAPA